MRSFLVILSIIVGTILTVKFGYRLKIDHSQIELVWVFIATTGALLALARI